jgi:hypothetical protein
MEMLFAFSLALIIGFGAGYAVRDFISRRRRQRSRLARFDAVPPARTLVAGGNILPMASTTDRGKANAGLDRTARQP